MNKRQKETAQCLRNFVKAKEEALKDQGSFFDENQYLLDEFCYLYEKDKNFNETKFRQFVLDIK